VNNTYPPFTNTQAFSWEAICGVSDKKTTCGVRGAEGRGKEGDAAGGGGGKKPDCGDGPPGI
jgi:hypothetical protein